MTKRITRKPKDPNRKKKLRGDGLLNAKKGKGPLALGRGSGRCQGWQGG